MPDSAFLQVVTITRLNATFTHEKNLISLNMSGCYICKGNTLPSFFHIYQQSVQELTKITFHPPSSPDLPQVFVPGDLNRTARLPF
jgi:hypothetical protein